MDLRKLIFRGLYFSLILNSSKSGCTASIVSLVITLGSCLLSPTMTALFAVESATAPVATSICDDSSIMM